MLIVRYLFNITSKRNTYVGSLARLRKRQTFSMEPFSSKSCLKNRAISILTWNSKKKYYTQTYYFSINDLYSGDITMAVLTNNCLSISLIVSYFENKAYHLATWLFLLFYINHNISSLIWIKLVWQDWANHHSTYCPYNSRVHGIPVWEARIGHPHRHELIRWSLERSESSFVILLN